MHSSRCPPLNSAMWTIVLPRTGDQQVRTDPAAPFTNVTPSVLDFQNKRSSAVWVSVTVLAAVLFQQRGRPFSSIALQPGTYRILLDVDCDQVAFFALNPNDNGLAQVWTEELPALSNNDDDGEDP